MVEEDGMHVSQYYVASLGEIGGGCGRRYGGGRSMDICEGLLWRGCSYGQCEECRQTEGQRNEIDDEVCRGLKIL